MEKNMNRPMTPQGHIKECAWNTLYWLKEHNTDQALYWVKALQGHIERNENAEPGKKITLRPEVQRVVNRALARYSDGRVPDPVCEKLDPIPVINKQEILNIKPSTYTLDEAGIARVAATIVELIDERARKSGGYTFLSPVSEAVRQSIQHHIKKEAKCN